MVLRGKWGQFSFLHTYHHVSIFLTYWWVTNTAHTGDTWFPVLLNSLVHAVMYFYYLLSESDRQADAAAVAMAVAMAGAVAVAVVQQHHRCAAKRSAGTSPAGLPCRLQFRAAASSIILLNVSYLPLCLSAPLQRASATRPRGAST